MSKIIKTPITPFVLGDAVDPPTLNQPLNDVDSTLDDVISYLDTTSAGFFDHDSSTTTALIFGWREGKFRKRNSTIVTITASTIAITASSTNYVEINVVTNTIIFNTTGFTATNIPLWELVTDGSSITSFTDVRTQHISAVSLSDNGNLIVGTTADNATDKLQITGTSYFSGLIKSAVASGDVMLVDNGDSRMSIHDGNGDYRLHSGSYYGTSDQYVSTGDGAVNISMNYAGQNGEIILRSAVIGTADAAITYATTLTLNPTLMAFSGGDVLIDNNKSVQGKNVSAAAFDLIKRDTNNYSVIGTTSYLTQIDSSLNPTWYDGTSTGTIHTTAATTYMDGNVYLGGNTSDGATSLIGINSTSDNIYVGGINTTTTTQNNLILRLNGIDKLTIAYIDDSATFSTKLKTSSDLIIESAVPQFHLYETGATVDNKYWIHHVDAETYSFRTYNDALAVTADIFVVNRTGTTVDSFNIDAISLQHNGNTVWDSANFAKTEIDALGIDAETLDSLNSTDFAQLSQAQSVTGVWTYDAIPVFNGGLSGASSPFTVDSNQLVLNLNADLLDGQEGSYYSIATHNHDADYLGISANAVSASKLLTSRTFDITGDITCDAVSFDGTGNVNLIATVNDDSHLHDTRYVRNDTSSLSTTFTNSLLTFDYTDAGNVDHIRFDEALNTYHFCADTSQATNGNATVYAGAFNEGGTLLSSKYINLSEKAANNGVATLNSSGEVEQGLETVIAASSRGCLIKMLTDQTFPLNTEDWIDWGASVYDTDSIWSSGSPNLLTVPTGVTKVQLTAFVYLNDSAGTCTRVQVWIDKNSNFDYGCQYLTIEGDDVTATTQAYNLATSVMEVVAGNTFNVGIITTTTNTMDAVGSRCWFAMEIIE